jgi:addiction module HigA family antidote
MNMYNPPHPGEFIREVYLESYGISYRTVAAKLNVAPSTFNRLINGQSSISSEMALRLSRTLVSCHTCNVVKKLVTYSIKKHLMELRWKSIKLH